MQPQQRDTVRRGRKRTMLTEVLVLSSKSFALILSCCSSVCCSRSAADANVIRGQALQQDRTTEPKRHVPQMAAEASRRINVNPRHAGKHGTVRMHDGGGEQPGVPVS